MSRPHTDNERRAMALHTERARRLYQLGLNKQGADRIVAMLKRGEVAK